MTDYAFERMKANENFLISHIEHLEVIELINDAIDISGQKSKDTNEWVKSSKHFFLHPILLTSSYAIHTHLITGNLPACFRELRFLFESLAFCHHAEKEFPNEVFFLEQMRNFDNLIRTKKRRKTISQMLKDLETDIGTRFGLNQVYKQLSHDWVHTQGFAEKVVKFNSDNSQLPSWAWILPITLDEKDLTTVNELNEYITIFRKILKRSMAS